MYVRAYFTEGLSRGVFVIMGGWGLCGCVDVREEQ